MKEENWKHDEIVRAALEKFGLDNKRTHEQLAGKLGFTPSRITKYLNLDNPDNTPEPDAPRVQAAALHFLRKQERSRKFVGSIFKNSVALDVENCIKQIRKTGDAGLIWSTAGRGKTCGALLYCENNPNTLFITVRQYGAGAGAVRRAVFDEYCASTHEKWPGNRSRMDWLEAQLNVSERLLIFDDAELMHISAFRFAFSLHDATGTPIVFIGNREILVTLRKSDGQGKLISRIGLVHEADFRRDEKGNYTADVKETAKNLIKIYASQSGEELPDLAAETLITLGSCRRLRKQLTQAVALKESDEKECAKKDSHRKTPATWSECFADGGKNLVRV